MKYERFDGTGLAVGLRCDTFMESYSVVNYQQLGTEKRATKNAQNDKTFKSLVGNVCGWTSV